MVLRISTIIGARPQFIKAAAVSRVFAADEDIEESLIDTGQHYDFNLSQVFFHELKIPEPKYRLQIGSGAHGYQTGRILEAVETVLLEEQPDLVMVYGDTNSTLAGALAAAKLKIPVAHIEAGLRSYDKTMPEEINRVLTDHMSRYLYAPTPSAIDNLVREGIAGNSVFQVGDVMFDAALQFSKFGKDTILDELGITPEHYTIVTIHRAENTDDPSCLNTIFNALMLLAEEELLVLPLHPRTKNKLEANNLLSRIEASEIKVIEPLGYIDVLTLLKNASRVITDSGGVQKEAFFFNKQCYTLRHHTEWTELVETGWNQLVPPVSEERILTSLRNPALLAQKSCDVFGDGNAAGKIRDHLKSVCA